MIGEKIKDGAEATLFDFKLEEVQLGEDADGEPVKSCIPRTSSPAPKKEKTKKEPALQKAFRTAFDAARAEHGEEIQLSHVRDRFFSLYPTGEADVKKADAAKRQAWSRALRNLPNDIETLRCDGIDFVRLKNSAAADFDIIGDHENGVRHV